MLCLQLLSEAHHSLICEKQNVLNVNKLNSYQWTPHILMGVALENLFFVFYLVSFPLVLMRNKTRQDCRKTFFDSTFGIVRK